jgi:hypothetical protein
MIDSTIVRARRQAAFAYQKGGDARGVAEASTAAAVANPARLIGSLGQRNDIAFVHDLVEGFTVADKATTPITSATRSPKPPTRGHSAQAKPDVQTSP